MIGFFEHQYLRYKKNHIKNLLALAKADGEVHEKEEKLLYKLGKRYGLKERQVRELIESEEKYRIDVPDNYDDKMNLLYDLILMVYADGKIDKNEVDFCEEAVERFGMKKGLVKWLFDQFERGIPPTPDQWVDIKEEVSRKFLIKN